MFLFRWPASLWFLAGGNVETSVALNVNLVYNLSASISEFDRDIELSALAFNLSANLIPDDPDEVGVSVQAGITLDDDNFNAVTLQMSAVPVFVLDQTGAASKDVTTAYNLTASVTASIFPDVVPVLAYNLSASLSAVLLISDNKDVAVAYNMTASIQMILQVQTGEITHAINANYGMSASINADVQHITSGGLVWSQKKGRYIAVRVGS